MMHGQKNIKLLYSTTSELHVSTPYRHHQAL